MSIIKKAILTGGGRATRLRPITHTINKHLLPLANRPMIFYAIEKAVSAGIDQIFINVNPGEDQLQKSIGDGSRWGISIKFFEQEGGPQGIAHVVKCAEKFIGDDPFMFYLSDNIILGSLVPFFEKFEQENLDCLLALSKVDDPQRFGVPQFDEKGNLVDVFEKPINPPSDFAVTGIYLFNNNFFKAFDHIEKSARGEYEIPSIFSYFLKNGLRVGYREITGWWKDTGKPEDLIKANGLVLQELNSNKFKLEGAVEENCKIENKVGFGKGSQAKNTHFIGPVIIGENCKFENCVIGPNVTIADGGNFKNATITNSILLSDCNVDGEIKIDGSIVGSNVHVVKNSSSGIHKMLLGDNTHIEV